METGHQVVHSLTHLFVSFFDPAHSAARLTLMEDLRDARDAQVILEAVRRNILPLIKRRLMASERESLAAGNVYVWEEAEDEGGLLRWTDGRRWYIASSSPS